MKNKTPLLVDTTKNKSSFDYARNIKKRKENKIINRKGKYKGKCKRKCKGKCNGKCKGKCKLKCKGKCKGKATGLDRP